VRPLPKGNGRRSSALSLTRFPNARTKVDRPNENAYAVIALAFANPGVLLPRPARSLQSSSRRASRDRLGDDAIALGRAQRALFAGSWLAQGYSSAAHLEQRRGCSLFWCPHPDRGLSRLEEQL